MHEDEVTYNRSRPFPLVNDRRLRVDCEILRSRDGRRFPTRARRPDYLAHNVHSNDTGDRDLLESRQVSTGRYDRSLHGRAHERPRANLYPDTKRAEWHQEDRSAGHVRSHLESHIRSAMPTVSCRLVEKRHGKTDKLSANAASLDVGEESHLRITAVEQGVPTWHARFRVVRDTRTSELREYRREIRDNAGCGRAHATDLRGPISRHQSRTLSQHQFGMVGESWSVQVGSYANRREPGQDLPQQYERDRNFRHSGIPSWFWEKSGGTSRIRWIPRGTIRRILSAEEWVDQYAEFDLVDREKAYHRL